MKRSFLSIISIFSITICYSQICFERTYGGVNYNESAFEAYQSLDSSYVMLGMYEFDYLTFLKISASGNLLSDHTISLSSNSSYYYMHRYDENNYLITHTHNIRKIDSLGNQLWLKPYISNTLDSRLNPTHDSGFISLAHLTGFPDTAFIIMKFDSSATLIKSDTIYPDTTYRYYPEFVKELADGNYLAGLNRYLDSVVLGITLFRIDTTGIILWSMQLPDDSTGIKDVIASADSGFILGGLKVAGGDTEFFALKKFDGANNLITDSSYIMSNGLYRYQLEPTGDGGIVIGCDMESPRQLGITKFDALLNLQWTRSFGGTGFDAFGSVRQTLDGGYILCGTKFQPGINNDYYLIKTDSLGIVDSLFTSNASTSLAQNFTQIQYYPNPITSLLKFESNSDIEQIELYTLLGEKMHVTIDYQLQTIDCSLLPPGIYILQASNKEKTWRDKVIKK